MPEPGSLRGPASFPQFHFSSLPPAAAAPDQLVVDLRPEARPSAELSALRKSRRERWKQAFVQWLGDLNRRHASLRWWAFTSTAKNVIASPLGPNCFDLLSVLEIAQAAGGRRIHVIGAPASVRAALGSGRGQPSGVLARVAAQVLRTGIVWLRSRASRRQGKIETLLFTYADERFRDGSDAFFGDLPARLAREGAGECAFVAFIHSGHASVPRKLREARTAPYEPLFAWLALPDFWWGVRNTLAAWRHARAVAPPPLEGADAGPLLRGALAWDIGAGGYFYNLMVYRAMRRLVARRAPRRILYPFENKALEKMLLLGAREGDLRCRLVGYQHTSITPRHTTLFFAPGEAAVTPLPDRIVTVGEVTRSRLEAAGNYPSGLLRGGCALRQTKGPLLGRRQLGDGAIRILVAASSSRQELAALVKAAKSAFRDSARYEVGVRPHPEFPVSSLPEELRAWVHANAKDLFGTSLASNLEWCDVVLYVSSTVALEALGRGRPVVNLDAGDIIDPDPVMEPLEYRRKTDVQFLQQAVDGIVAMEGELADRAAREAASFVGRYFREPEPSALAAFLA